MNKQETAKVDAIIRAWADDVLSVHLSHLLTDLEDLGLSHMVAVMAVVQNLQSIGTSFVIQTIKEDTEENNAMVSGLLADMEEIKAVAMRLALERDALNIRVQELEKPVQLHKERSVH